MTRFEEITYHAVLHFGDRSQVAKSIEELGELIAALGRVMNGGNSAPVIEELADVQIMLAQLRLIYGDDAVNDRIEFKLNRLEKLMEKS